jgi:hypothetical protein
MQRQRKKVTACAPDKKCARQQNRESRAARARVCITTEIILIGGGQMFLYVIFIFIASLSLSLRERARTQHTYAHKGGEREEKLRHSPDSWNRSLARALLLPTQVIYVKLFPVALLHGTPFPLGDLIHFLRCSVCLPLLNINSRRVHEDTIVHRRRGGAQFPITRPTQQSSYFANTPKLIEFGRIIL